MVKSMSERVRCNNVDRNVREFMEFIDQSELHDLPLKGRQFTWTNYQEVAIHSRLDRFLVAIQWLERFNIVQWGLSKSISDHCPIMISDSSQNWGAKPFRFVDAWLSNKNCLRVAREGWERLNVSGLAGWKIVKKMKAMKESLKEWSKQEFGNPIIKLQNKEKDLHQLDLTGESRQLTDEERQQMNKLREEFWKLSRLVESIWRQKSRIYKLAQTWR